MRYFVGFLITIGLIIVLILIVFGGGSPKTKLPTAKTLVSYADSSAEARMTIDGPVNGDQIHKQIQINVTKNVVTYTRINGYEHTVVTNPQYGSNKNAYANFLQALSHAGFTKGDADPAHADERGFCPLGNRYIFEFIQNGVSIERFWSSSCGKPKTYLGDFQTTTELFKAQVPDFNDVNQESRLN